MTLSSAADVYCILQGNSLSIYEPIKNNGSTSTSAYTSTTPTTTPTTPTPTPTPSTSSTTNATITTTISNSITIPSGYRLAKSLELLGAHLTAGKSKEFTIAPSKGPSATFIFATPEEKNGWVVSLGRVPGLFRRVTDYYIIGKSWGHGATSEVHECTSIFDGRRLAVKTRRKARHDKDATRAMHNELRILQLCAKSPHPSIPLLYDYFFDTDGSIDLVMELMEGGELFDWIARKDHLTEGEAHAVFKQIVQGVAHLHRLGIAHRDLKPSNLMYVTNPDDCGGGGNNTDKINNNNHHPQHQHTIFQIKIMDYDLAKVDYSPAWEAHSPCGTTSYMAPEVISQRKYGQSIDIWSLGVILYVLLCGRMPFCGRTSGTIHKRVSKGSFEMESSIWDEVSGEAKGLIKRLLQLDPTARPTAEEIMEDAWLRGENDDDGGGDDGNTNDEKPPGPFRRSRSKGTLCTTTNLRELSSQRRQVSLPPVTNGDGSSRSRNNNINNNSNGDLVALNGGDNTGDTPYTTSPPPQIDTDFDNRDTTTGTGNEGEVGSSLKAALDYDLAPIRQQAEEAMIGGISNNHCGGKMGGRFRRLISGKKNSSMEEEEEEERDVDVEELRMQLSLVGVAAGLGDRRGQDEEELGGGSPVATMKKKKKGDMFDDIGGEEVEDADV